MGRMPAAPPAELFTADEWRRLGTVLGLTLRQCQMAQLMCEGLTYKAIAAQAHISINTVRMHSRGLFAKLGVHDRVGLILTLIATERELRRRAGEIQERS